MATLKQDLAHGNQHEVPQLRLSTEAELGWAPSRARQFQPWGCALAPWPTVGRWTWLADRWLVVWLLVVVGGCWWWLVVVGGCWQVGSGWFSAIAQPNFEIQNSPNPRSPQPAGDRQIPSVLEPDVVFWPQSPDRRGGDSSASLERS
jgi:hypothetical protein